jgi:hypothetical protein
MLVLGIVVAVIVLLMLVALVIQLPEIRRYMKIRSM